MRKVAHHAGMKSTNLRGLMLDFLMTQGPKSTVEIHKALKVLKKLKKDGTEERLKNKKAPAKRTIQYELNVLSRLGLVHVTDNGYAVKGYEFDTRFASKQQLLIEAKNVNFYLRRGWRFVATLGSNQVIIEREILPMGNVEPTISKTVEEYELREMLTEEERFGKKKKLYS
jgi:Fe2+ or Zn2+ uptake regulation protein